MPDISNALIKLIEDESIMPLPPALGAIAEAARLRHGDAIAAVLVYGSCLRDKTDEGGLVDLYLLADDYRSVHDSPFMRLANRLLPPNVYFLQAPFEDRWVRAKYALVGLDHLAQLVAAKTFHPYFWARFAQPTAIAWVRNAAVRDKVIATLAQAATTLLEQVQPLLPADAPASELWVRSFSETYRAELRAERPGRAAELYRLHAGRYDRIAQLVRSVSSETGDQRSAGDRRTAVWRWRGRRILGKGLSVLRLMKAAFTFEDGPSYLLWKIERHSGVSVALTPWQRRHPIVASSILFWQLYRRGAFR
jgi:hypothetical protein